MSDLFLHFCEAKNEPQIIRFLKIQLYVLRIPDLSIQLSQKSGHCPLRLKGSGSQTGPSLGCRQPGRPAWGKRVEQRRSGELCRPEKPWVRKAKGS